MNDGRKGGNHGPDREAEDRRADTDSRPVGAGEFGDLAYPDSYWGVEAGNNEWDFKRTNEKMGAWALFRKSHPFLEYEKRRYR